MSLNKVPAGRDLPNDFNVVIEIPMNADPIKYEVDKESGAIFVDRFMGTSMHYPCNYGYVPNTIAGDGDPVDVLVITPFPLIPGVVVRCRPIGVLKMEDDGGQDAKVLAVHVDQLGLIGTQFIIQDATQLSGAGIIEPNVDTAILTFSVFISRLVKLELTTLVVV